MGGQLQQLLPAALEPGTGVTPPSSCPPAMPPSPRTTPATAGNAKCFCTVPRGLQDQGGLPHHRALQVHFWVTGGSHRSWMGRLDSLCLPQGWLLTDGQEIKSKHILGGAKAVVAADLRFRDFSGLRFSFQERSTGGMARD